MYNGQLHVCYTLFIYNNKNKIVNQNKRGQQQQQHTKKHPKRKKKKIAWNMNTQRQPRKSIVIIRMNTHFKERP